MNEGAIRGRGALAWLVVLLVVAGLACAQAGEVLTPAEATERARGPAVEQTGAEVESTYQIGDTVLLTGRSFLVNLLDEPGGTIRAGQERGAEVEITNVAQAEGEIWYEIDAPTGSGWVSADQVEPVPGAEPGEAEAGAEGSEGTPGEISVGDTVYLTGVGFLINMYDTPGGRLIANQQRGATVTILAITEQDGVTWYQIDADTGRGWVAEENITTEAP